MVHTFALSTTKLCYCSIKEVIHVNEVALLCFNKTLLTKTGRQQVHWIHEQQFPALPLDLSSEKCQRLTRWRPSITCSENVTIPTPFLSVHNLTKYKILNKLVQLQNASNLLMGKNFIKTGVSKLFLERARQ